MSMSDPHKLQLTSASISLHSACSLMKTCASAGSLELTIISVVCQPKLQCCDNASTMLYQRWRKMSKSYQFTTLWKYSGTIVCMLYQHATQSNYNIVPILPQCGNWDELISVHNVVIWLDYNADTMLYHCCNQTKLQRWYNIVLYYDTVGARLVLNAVILPNYDVTSMSYQRSCLTL